MDGDGSERDRLLERLVTLQKVHARLHAVEQKTLAELAALPLPAAYTRNWVGPPHAVQ